ncbi:MAG TPA: class E sortase [Thermoleophilaceae bacterium]|jgi:sortase A
MRAVLRFVASVLMVSGAMLIADAVLTLTWEEPVSAFLQDKQQAKLKKQLSDLPPSSHKLIHFKPLKGHAIGEIMLPAIHKNAFVVQGTDGGSLRKGPGHYPDTPLPGKRGTVGIAGHRTTHGAPFRHIDSLKPGNRIILAMPYGTFTYKVERTRIVDPNATWILHTVRYNRLILSACHPLYSAAQRIVVFARLVSRTRARVVRS